ncbi:MAG: hypothetical protein U0Z26_18200 [Anaerolineales bacterium]
MFIAYGLIISPASGILKQGNLRYGFVEVKDECCLCHQLVFMWLLNDLVGSSGLWISVLAGSIRRRPGLGR